MEDNKPNNYKILLTDEKEEVLDLILMILSLLDRVGLEVGPI